MYAWSLLTYCVNLCFFFFSSRFFRSTTSTCHHNLHTRGGQARWNLSWIWMSSPPPATHPSSPGPFRKSETSGAYRVNRLRLDSEKNPKCPSKEPASTE
ncbi:hypothetical protein I7I48_02332 [Histoplasma ohiense]|nr:hypothetical protein I7I48_02332 [Histoplasma ohiense (nom. inval.)]